MADTASKQAKLDQIAAEIIKKNICPDLAKTAKHLVFGEGSPDARVMFIGEAPGKNEDETGRPFVGAAGKFLSELLKGIGLAREDVYITSILKYRPPNNRDPRPEEKDAFWPYLLAQIELIRPRLIVALGRHSANCFLPEAGAED
jgi:uracil-DNA glycosylase